MISRLFSFSCTFLYNYAIKKGNRLCVACSLFTIDFKLLTLSNLLSGNGVGFVATEDEDSVNYDI